MKNHLHKNERPVSKRLSWRLMISIGVVVLVLTTGLVISYSRQRAHSNEPGPSVPNAKQPRTNGKGVVTRNVGGQIVQIDSQTGQVRPLTPEEAKKLAEGLMTLANQSTDGLQPVSHPDGSVSVDLQGRFQNVVVAKKTEDGNVAQSCIDNPESGAAFFGIDPKLVGVKSKTNSQPASAKPTDK
jgi:hypothetical protein